MNTTIQLSIRRSFAAVLIGVRRAHHIINDYTIAFFNQHLNGTDEPLLDATMAGPYSQVTVVSRNGVASGQVSQR